jgi:hypothetical protein
MGYLNVFLQPHTSRRQTYDASVTDGLQRKLWPVVRCSNGTEPLHRKLNVEFRLALHDFELHNHTSVRGHIL